MHRMHPGERQMVLRIDGELIQGESGRVNRRTKERTVLRKEWNYEELYARDLLRDVKGPILQRSG